MRKSFQSLRTRYVSRLVFGFWFPYSICTIAFTDAAIRDARAADAATQPPNVVIIDFIAIDDSSASVLDARSAAAGISL